MVKNTKFYELESKLAPIGYDCYNRDGNSLTLFRELGLDNTFNLHEKYIGFDDELFNLELVKAERALRTFERYYTSGCEVLVDELKEVLKGQDYD